MWRIYVEVYSTKGKAPTLGYQVKRVRSNQAAMKVVTDSLKDPELYRLTIRKDTDGSDAK